VNPEHVRYNQQLNFRYLRVAARRVSQIVTQLSLGDTAQAALKTHLGRAPAGGGQPALKVTDLHVMLDSGQGDSHHGAGDAAPQVLIAPGLLAEDAQRLTDSYKSVALTRMLDAFGIEVSELAGAPSSRGAAGSFAIYSSSANSLD